MGCWKCSSNFNLSINPVLPDRPIIGVGNIGNYCSKCGESLLESCNSCFGSGEITINDGYCTNCGKSLQKTVSCTSCNGSGKQIKIHVCSVFK